MADSVFHTGKVDLREGGSGVGGFVSIKSDETIELVPLFSLDKMVSANFHEYWDVNPAVFHPCIGKDCPGCKLTDNKPRFKGYLPVVLKDKSVKIWPFTISIYRQLELLDNELEGGLGGYLVKFSRTGTGKMGTRYTVTCVGKKVDISGVEPPEFLNILGPTTVEDITKALAEKGLIDGDASDSEDDEWGSL